jgi:thiamine-phosphate pyrophosphorylase
MISPRYIYVVTDGTAGDAEFEFHRSRIVEHARAAAANGATHFQIREKRLTARYLLELGRDVVEAVEGSTLKILVNDRADVAVAAHAHGVHLTSRSISAADVRRNFGDKLLIAVSAHSVDDFLKAKAAGADLVVYGPVFDTPGKSAVGIEKLREVCGSVDGFPVVAIGGIDTANAVDAINAGSAGIAGIRSLSSGDDIARMVAALNL